MTLAYVVVTLIKILVMILFLLNAAAIATWADRRQSAMVQDRIGPNRATVYLPSWLARGVVFGFHLLLSVFPIFLSVFKLNDEKPKEKLIDIAKIFQMESLDFGAKFEKLKDLLTKLLTFSTQHMVESIMWGSQLFVFVVWLSLLGLCSSVRSKGKRFAFEGFLESIDPRVFLFGGIILHGLVWIGTSSMKYTMLHTIHRAMYLGFAAYLILFGLYASARIPSGKVALRLAGMIHAMADAIKLIWKEDFVPPRADKLLHGLAPIMAMFPALITCAVIPFGDHICLSRSGPKGELIFKDLLNLAPFSYPQGCPGNFRPEPLQIMEMNVGILYIFAVAGTAVVGAALAGWSSDNKYSLLGGLRAAGQMISYEVAMGLSLVGLFLIYGNLRLQPMVQWQGANAWGIFVQPFAFLLFLTALCAETKRVPFDQPEGESEIVAGYFVEYSGMKFGMFYTGEYLELIASSALLVTLFFGGYQIPFLHRDGITVAFGNTILFEYKIMHGLVSLLYVGAFFFKTILMTWIQIFFRWTLPRFRYDQVMKLGWTKLLPLSLGNILVTAAIVLIIDSASSKVQGTLKWFADCSQALVLVLSIVAVVALVWSFVKPAKHRQFLKSTSSKFAAALGGAKTGPQQA